VALTAHGKPFALIVAADEDSLLEMEAAVRRARAQLAVSKMRQRAVRTGLDKLSEEVLEAEIQAARSERSVI
jgi:antitoxin (DNA-binding transcriptional repressor) of toxin-antitoxin stability system